jgi:hypothetical protein
MIKGIEALRQDGQPTPDWILGGGTALMIWADHRLSRDIDAFIDDPQYLPLLSPRLSGEQVWDCQAYDESAHYLKLRYPEGEIDFIVASAVTDIPAETRVIPAGDGIPEHRIRIEHPVEIALKKLRYRGDALKIRDAFDICVVDHLYPDLLKGKLGEVSGLRSKILSVLGRTRKAFFEQYLEELDIQPQWQSVASKSHARIRDIIVSIPAPG